MTTAVFTRGSILRHILVMTSANTISLLALVASDLVDMYFLSQLGQQELAAAIGFAGILLFFLVSVGLGLQIAMGALVAQAEGRHQRPLAQRLCTHAMLFSVSATALVTIPTWFCREALLALLGAEGTTLGLAASYSAIVLPATPVLVCGMCAAAALRALGDARRSMLATLAAAGVTVVLDPLLIVSLEMGLRGAALAAVVSRIALMAIGLSVLVGVHRFLCRVKWFALWADLQIIVRLAAPAMLTTLATPLGSSYVLNSMAAYGDNAVAGAAILGRIVPVVFAAIFGLSVSIGPIIGQNAGADRYDRVRETLLTALFTNTVYVFAMWILMYMVSDWIIAVFGAQEEAAHLIDFYATWLVGAFVFAGMLIIAITGFNNLDMANAATLMNIGRVGLGVLPFVAVGSTLLGAVGVLVGETVAVVIWGIIAFLVLWRRVERMARCHATVAASRPLVEDVGPMAYCSSVCQLGTALTVQGEERAGACLAPATPCSSPARIDQQNETA